MHFSQKSLWKDISINNYRFEVKKKGLTWSYTGILKKNSINYNSLPKKYWSIWDDLLLKPTLGIEWLW